MTKLVGKLALCAAALVAVYAPKAEASSYGEWPKWYVGFNGSLNLMNDSDISFNGGSSDASYDAGYGIGAVVGYLPSFTDLPGLRLEAEIAHREADVDKYTSGGVSVTGTDDVSSTAYMANVYYDIATGTKVVPYLGAGFGWAEVDFPSAAFGNTDDSDNAIAWQLMAGLSYEPKMLRHTVLSVGYKYFATDDLELEAGAGNKIEYEYGSHNFEAGVKFRF